MVECLQIGIPFIATNSGGTAELIHPDDRDGCLVPVDPTALAAKLAQVLQDGLPRPRMYVSQAETARRWLAFHAPADGRADRATVQKLPARAQSGAPLVSVCL